MFHVSMGRIPLSLKIAYSVFMAIQIPAYWHHYGPSVFLYFCDVALLLTLVALWTESSLLCSAASVGIFLPQLLWINDFIFALAGIPLSPLTAYMFDDSRPIHIRLLSTFHFWMPVMLLWLVWRVGFNRRGFLAWGALTSVLLLVCFLLVPPPGHYADPHLLVNINFVYGFSLTEEQSFMNRHLYLVMLMLAWPVATSLPTHLLFRWLMPPAR
jgi:hypothetical protein